MHPFELLQAHGFNLFEESSTNFASNFTPFFSGCSANSVQVLSGNGWHLPSMASWMAYVLSNVRRIDRNMTLNPERAVQTQPSDDAESEMNLEKELDKILLHGEENVAQSGDDTTGE